MAQQPQIAYNQRLSHGIVMSASYVRLRQMEQWGWQNQYLGIPQASVRTSLLKSCAYRIPMEATNVRNHFNYLTKGAP